MKSIAQLLFAAIAFAPVLSALDVGDESPCFSASDDKGKDWSACDFLDKKNVIVYFYPAAMTGGCTKQACSYRDGADQLKKLDAVVVGVSGDQVEALKYFKIAEKLNFTLLSDAKGEIAKAFGVPTRPGGTLQRTVQGKEVTLVRDNTASRWTFVINKKGKIIYKNSKVNPTKDLTEVAKAIKASK
jgi:peroxiredoxin Q/BCP